MSGKVKDELVKIIDAADRVSEIAKGLLSYCRPSAAVRKPINILYPVKNALSMIEQNARNSGVALHLSVSENIPEVQANIDEMQQVFLNLFLNALDAMPEGGQLNIEVKNGDDLVQISVQDSGKGIPENIHQKIFEPFFTTKEEGKGTGLGLSICAGLIRSHQGSISVDSEAGHGTTIRIELPVHATEKSN